MTLQKPLFWQQGLFLQPQHFQLLAHSADSQITPFHEHLHPNFWGVGDVTIERGALGTKTFALASGTFLFSDGTFVDLSVNGVVEPRKFDDAWVEGGKPFTIYIGLKKWNSQGENVSVQKSGQSTAQIATRFIAPSEPVECKDLHAGGPTGEVQQMSYLLRLFWESEIELLGDYLLIPLAQLERSGDSIILSQKFIPPCLNIFSSELLLGIVKDIRDQIAFRSRQLEELKRQRGIQTAEFGSRDMVYLLALRSLNRYAPLLYHVTETRQVTPWEVFGILRQVVGEFSTFSESVTVMGEAEENGTRLLPTYDHATLWACFTGAQQLISRLLDEITAGPEYVVPLVYDGTYFSAELKPAIFEKHNRYYLVMRTEEDPKSLMQSIMTSAKLSAREHLPILIARALPGITLEHLPVPPQELPRRSFSLYFSIDAHHDQWGMTEKKNNIALYWDEAPQDLEAELMVVSK
jgi:type VI secretion system protein ImpJ